MSAAHDQARKRIVFVLAGIAGALLLLLAIAALIDGPARSAPDRAGQFVFPGFAQQSADIRRIRVRLADTSYTLASSDTGWTMLEAGGYPIRADRLAALAEGLATLQWEESRTRDPEKFDRIGLGDPDSGGTGALIEIVDGSGEPVFSLIAGRKAGRVYGRLPEDQIAYRLTGDLPPLYTRDAWLDFDVLDVQADAIRAVRITDLTRETIYLRRAPGQQPQDFRPGPPDTNRPLVSRLSAARPALALARFAPLDARPADTLTSPPVATHITETFDGLEVSIIAYREPDGLFVTLRAVEAGEGARRAETINSKTEGWAFELQDIDWADFTPMVSSIVRPPEPVGSATDGPL